MITRYAASRRAMLLGMGAALMPATLRAADLPTIAPAQAGFAPDVAERLDAAVREGQAPGIHSVLAVRDGRLALERYYEGADERWGDQLGTIAFGPDTLHDMRSVTKSIVALLYGIALADGKVPAP